MSTRIRFDKEFPVAFQLLGDAQQQINNGGLDPLLRHLVLLRVSQMNGCAFCVDMHTREARQDGETNQRLDRLVVWRHVDDYNPAERAALAWAERLTHLQPVGNHQSERANLEQHFSPKEITVLTLLVGMINLWNRVQASQH